MCIPSHPVHTAAHCNPLQLAANHPVHIQCTHCISHYIFSAHCSQPSVHTAANCSHLQSSTLQLDYPVHTTDILSSAHCSYTIQCTLQLYHSVHTAATPSGSNTIQYIQCTFGPPQGKPIPLLAYLQSSQQTLMVDCSSP